MSRVWHLPLFAKWHNKSTIKLRIQVKSNTINHLVFRQRQFTEKCVLSSWWSAFRDDKISWQRENKTGQKHTAINPVEKSNVSNSRHFQRCGFILLLASTFFGLTLSGLSCRWNQNYAARDKVESGIHYTGAHLYEGHVANKKIMQKCAKYFYVHH